MNWKFEKVTSRIKKQGIRYNDIQVFDKFRFAPVVRESIQNSLDISNMKIPELLEIKTKFTPSNKLKA